MSATIYALASASGRAGVAVWRLSGEGTAAALSALTGKPLPEPRKAVRARLRDGSGEVIDDGLVLWFPAPASFTGEDVAELHLHGGRAVAAALAETLGALGLRPAEPGEFSRRAFLGGKLDLTRAEAIADLVDSETGEQRRQALRQLDGGLARLVEDWRSRLVQAMAHLEAVIDFSDEDIPDGLLDRSAAEVAALRAEMAAHLDERRAGERLRDSDCEIEAEGVRRARTRAVRADLRLCVFDGALYPELDAATRQMIDDATLVVFNKRDLMAVAPPGEVAGRPALALSAGSGDGVDGLVAALGRMVEDRFAVGPAPVLTRERHRKAVAEAVAALARFDPLPGIEMAAEDLRLAAGALGRITGRVDVDEILDVIFHEFCIGK